MRFVEPKSKEQQARAILFRGRERLVRQRTALVNALRSDLYEYGHIVPKRIGEIKRIEAIIDEPNNDLPDLMREECYDLLEQIAEKAARIETKLEKLKGVAAGTGTARQLQTMPGIGPVTALAIEAFAPNMEAFKRGRDFAAWLGPVPHQHSSGGKQRFGRVSKAGQANIRRLLIIGAMSLLAWHGRRSIPEGSWLDRMKSQRVQVFHDHVLVKEPGTSESTPWHQDSPYYFVDGVQNVSFCSPMDVVTDASLRCVAGSHSWKKAVLPTRWLTETGFFPNDNDYMPVPDPELEGMDIKEWQMAPGDAVAFNYGTLHGARGNISDQRRRAFSLRFVGDDARYVERAGPTSPPFPGHEMMPGQVLREDWFPVIYQR